MFGEAVSIPVREEVSVDPFEVLYSEFTLGEVLEEALVPLLQLLRAELRLGGEVCHHRRLQLTVSFAHNNHKNVQQNK